MAKVKGEKAVWSSVIIVIVFILIGGRFGGDLLLGGAGSEDESGPETRVQQTVDRDVFDDLDSDTEQGETFGVHRFGEREAPRKASDAIRLATYNVENLFDGVDDPASPKNDVEWEKPEAEVASVAAAIRALDADILALQEIESESVLRAFRDEHLQGLGYDHIASLEAGDSRGIEQSVLSRFPITDARVWDNYDTGSVHPPRWRDRPNKYAGERIVLRRSPLMATVEVPSSVTGGAPYELTLLVVHHKSGGGNDYWREAEADAIIGMIKAFAGGADRNVAVLGDFNAKLYEDSVKAYLESGYQDAWRRRPRGPEARTHESGRAIDFILVNQAMAAEVVPNSAFVLGTIARPEGVDFRTYDPPPGYAADHYPAAVDLRPVDR
ncbi:MAG: endonuclease/exonuclease/phosphatase family protein [Planctomycetota bacterium]